MKLCTSLFETPLWYLKLSQICCLLNLLNEFGENNLKQLISVDFGLIRPRNPIYVAAARHKSTIMTKKNLKNPKSGVESIGNIEKCIRGTWNTGSGNLCQKKWL